MTLTFQSDICQDLSWCQTITLLLQKKRLKQLRLTPLATTVYLSHLCDLTPNYYVSFICLPKRIRNEGCFIFLLEFGGRMTKSISEVLKYEMIFLFISIKNDSVIKAFFLLCLSIRPFYCGWYSAIMHCYRPVRSSKQVHTPWNSLPWSFIWNSKQPWRYISS